MLITKDDLDIMQNWPLDKKIRVTQSKIIEWYNHYNGNVYVSFSGGKDSLVLLDLARRVYPDIPAVFIDTGLEFPEIKSFVSTFDNVTTIRPKMNFMEVIKKYGYPVISKEVSNCIYGARLGQKGRMDSLNGNIFNKAGKKIYDKSKYKYLLDAPFKISDKCCNVTKKAPSKTFESKTKLKPIVGTRTEESSLRKMSWYKTGCNSFEGRTQKSRPLSFWTEQDILKYISITGIKLCSLYGDVKIEKDSYSFWYGTDPEPDRYKLSGENSTGCVYCMFGCQYDKKYFDDLTRFEKLKITHPKLYNYCINGGEYKDGLWQPNSKGLGLNKVLDFINIGY